MLLGRVGGSQKGSDQKIFETVTADIFPNLMKTNSTDPEVSPVQEKFKENQIKASHKTADKERILKVAREGRNKHVTDRGSEISNDFFSETRSEKTTEEKC